MINIEFLRTNPEQIKSAAQKRGDTVSVDLIIELDSKRRTLIAESDSLRARRNEVSKQLSQAKEKPPEIIKEMREVGTRIKNLETESRANNEQLRNLLLAVPNTPEEDVPVGKDDSENIVIRTSGHIPKFDFEPLPHWELSEKLGIIDFSRGVKLSGSRFYLLKGAGAKLQRALISWLLDIHTTEHGYQELYLPYLVSRTTVTGSGHLPKFADTMYHDEEDDMWLVPTAEVPITNIHSDEILSIDQFPLKYVSHTPCFRREKAAAGNDTRGIKRGHQFDKVEMYQFVEPSSSQQALNQLVIDAEAVCEELKIPHRVKLQCTGDMGFSVVKTYDIELWAAGCNEWLEVSSCSNCKDFQARRANIRYRPASDTKPEFVHTLNGSGLGIPRTMACIIEHYQQKDGSILIPSVLQPYTGFTKID
ncbi:MAG: serine--tRNA ligase [Chloroflexota bacterium]|nr:serine--tRNA ligase [Chloroflexota bacterium]